MKIEGTRFGTIVYGQEDVIRLKDGMIGFPDCFEYVVVSTHDESMFRWLQSIEEPKLAFLVAYPERFLPDYSPEIDILEAEELQLTSDSPYLVFVTTTIPHGKPKEARANLAAPIIINCETNVGKQVILEGEAYTIRYPIYQTELVAEAA